ncbi:replicative DNA helicase [Erysipelotrichaceae bacterium OttesenSCG-928-M19]|nr:replicative DNA helicase [Erysipelotrichaceae bacterium OttesenSCG-928-M19]
MMRTLPHNIEAEQAVLGAMILSDNAINETLNYLKYSDFYLKEHQLIFEALRELKNTVGNINIATLTTYLVEEKQLSEVGGVEYLTSISQAVFSSANINYYIDIVLERSLLRRLISTSEKIASQGYESELDIEDILQDAEKSILEVTRDHKTSDFQTSEEIVKSVHDNLIELSKSDGSLTGIASGFSDIDKITNGFQKGDLIILAARPSVGKTTFALNLAQKAAVKSKQPVVIFSLEMSANQLMVKMLSSAGRIESNRLQTGQLTKDDWDRYTHAASVLSNSKIFIDDTPGLKMVEIASKCRKLEREQGLGLIIIDYLQLITGSERNRESRQVEVSDISRALKGLARELNVPIIALSQLSRNVEQRAEKRPMMSDLRESGAIEQDADIVAFLYRDDYYNKDDSDKPGQVEIIFEKHRNGARGKVNLAFEQEYSNFTGALPEVLE